MLVQNGTLMPGDIIVAGNEWGRVRALVNDNGEQIKEAPPAMPVEVLGLAGHAAGRRPFAVVENEARAREITEYRQRLARDKAVAKHAGQRGSLEQMMIAAADERAEGIPAGHQGRRAGFDRSDRRARSTSSAPTRCVRASFIRAPAASPRATCRWPKPRMPRSSASTSVPTSRRATAAERAGIEIRYYNIIYDLVDDVKAAMSGLLSPERRETFIGNAEILEVFNITKVGKVAGCRVTEGKVERGAGVRLIRDNVVIHEGKLKTLKRFKDEVSEVPVGQECGMAFENYEDIRAGDVIECFRVEMVTRTL